MVVAIDGPAGAGKSTLARALSRELRWRHLDSGAMYRCVGLMSLSSEEPPGELARAAKIELGDRVLLDGRDVTAEIRTAEVSEASSRVAADPAVRRALVAHQRALLEQGDWVAEGRDIGTVVAPDAALKLFLIASVDERARRRAAQTGADLRTELAAQAERDDRDTSREDSPLEPAADATVIDTTPMTVEELVHRVVGMVRAAAYPATRNATATGDPPARPRDGE